MLLVAGEIYSPLAFFKGHNTKEIIGFDKLLLKRAKSTGFIVIPDIKFKIVFYIFFVTWALSYSLPTCHHHPRTLLCESFCDNTWLVSCLKEIKEYLRNKEFISLSDHDNQKWKRTLNQK